MWITMVKAHCVIITAQVDMNLSVVCERIMELQPGKKMNLMMNESLDLDSGWCRLLTLFWRSLSGHIIVFCIVFQM